MWSLGLVEQYILGLGDNSTKVIFWDALGGGIGIRKLVYNTMLEGEETIIGVEYGWEETIRIVWTIYMGASDLCVQPKEPPGYPQSDPGLPPK